MAETKLYRHFAHDGMLLYVGVALNAPKRHAAHLGNSPWGARIARIDIESYPTRAEAVTAEQVAITLERPLYNSHHNGGAAKFRSTRSVMLTFRVADALVQAIDRAALEDSKNRSQMAVELLENALLTREQ